MDEYIKRTDVIGAVCFGCNQEFSDEPCEPDACAIRQSIMALPTADVVPKSEVVCSLDKLMKALQKRQNYCDKEAEKCGYYLERRGEFDGESAGLDYCLEKIAELKKKYMEAEE